MRLKGSRWAALFLVDPSFRGSFERQPQAYATACADVDGRVRVRLTVEQHHPQEAAKVTHKKPRRGFVEALF